MYEIPDPFLEKKKIIHILLYIPGAHELKVHVNFHTHIAFVKYVFRVRVAFCLRRSLSVLPPRLVAHVMPMSPIYVSHVMCDNFF